MGDDALERLLPWRRPFLLIDRLLGCTPREEIATLKRVTANDPLLAGKHCFPAFLVLEGLGQTAALLYRLTYTDTDGALPLLGFLRASLERLPVMPGETLRFEVRATKMTRGGGVFEGRATVRDRPVARAELAFASEGGSPCS